MICILPSMVQISALRVEACSWFSYYFYKVVFLTVVNLPSFILQYNGMHKVKNTNIFGLYK